MEPNDYSEHQTENSVIADLVARSTRVETINGLPFAIIPGDIPALIEDAVAPPRYVKQNRRLDTLESFREFLDGHYAPDGTVPALFADKAQSRFTAVFDYHLSEDIPGRCENVAYFNLEFDPRYTRWSEKFDKWISQGELADLIDRNQAAMVSPSAADMLALAENLEIHQNHKVVGKKSTRNGVGEISYEVAEGSESTKIPPVIVIGVPIYKGLHAESAVGRGPIKAWQIPLRVRYRVYNGAVTFMLVADTIDDILDDAWNGVVADVAAWDSANVYEGRFTQPKVYSGE